MKIKIFTPPKFKKKILNLNKLNIETNKHWIYSSSGKASIYHILKNLNINKILIPIYICKSILEPLNKLNIKPIFYDVDIEDLNPSLKSIQQLSKKYNIKAVLAASMYGNPANLIEIEKFCKKNNIFLLDDAAQSFGAKLNNRYIGTFGEAGFFSFSPGKPTAGHMGSFFWSNKNITVKRTNHCLIHYIRWLDFYYNRYKIYDEKFIFFKKALSVISIISMKYINILNDDICKFEKKILGGILCEAFSFRQLYHNEFIKKFSNFKYFRIVSSIRGIPNNHKLVLLFNKKEMAKKFITYMKYNNIYASNGYNLLSNNLKELPNAKIIDGCVVELPIENDQNKMKYLFKKVREFEYKNIEKK